VSAYNLERRLSLSDAGMETYVLAIQSALLVRSIYLVPKLHYVSLR